MDWFKHILVAASPGHLDVPTWRSAVALATANEARVTVLDVVEPLASRRRSINTEGRTIDLQQSMLCDRAERLHRFVERTRGTTEVTARVKTGNPAIEVIRHVISYGCDLVIVGRPKPAKGQPSVSSGVMQLLRKCPVPVWAMRPTRAKTLRVLALVDPNLSDPIRDSLTDLVLEMASSMVRHTDGELHVAHAWSFAALDDEHRWLFEMLMVRHGIKEQGGQIHLVEGEPGWVLPLLAKQLNITLIVMGAVARTGLTGFIMGNTAETMLRSVECSVLAVKPAGFVSPVQLSDRRPDEVLFS